MMNTLSCTLRVAAIVSCLAGQALAASATERVERGLALQAEGRIGEAILEYRAACALEPDLLAAHLGLQNCLLARGRDEELVATYDAHLAKAPEDIFRRYLAARVRARPEDRRNALASIVAARPDLASAWLDLGRVQARLDRPSEALASFDRAAALLPGEFGPVLARATVLQQTGDVEAAQTLLAGIVGREANNAQALHALGRLYLDPRPGRGARVADPSRQLLADRFLQAAVAADPDDFAPVSDLARLYSQMRRAREARRLLVEYSTRHPGDPRPIVQLAEHDIAEGLIEIAEQHLMTYLERYPGDPDILINLAVVRQRRGFTLDAEEQLRHAVRLHPRHAIAWINLGHVCLKAGKYPEAIAALESALDIDGVDPAEIYTPLARAHAGFATALGSESERLANSQAEDDVAVSRLRASEARRELESARRAYERALVLQPDHGTLHFELARVLLGLEEPAACLAAIARASAAPAETPDMVALDYLAACAHWLAGDITSGLERVERILTVDAQHAGALDLRRQLEIAQRAGR